MIERRSFQELVDAGILEIGDGYRAKNAELGGQGPIFLRSAYLQDSGFVENMPERFITTNAGSFGPKLAQFGDVVITTKGNSTGRVGVIRTKQVGAVYSPHLSYWRSKDQSKLDQGFLQAWSSSPEFKSQLAGKAYSTDMAPYLSLRDQLTLSISLPPLAEQSVIAGALGALDDKIELNRRMNETLEAMARAMFKDWFVDFGPTRRKVAGETDSVAILGGLLPDPAKAAELAALFPDSFGDNGLPMGWNEQPLDKIAEFLNGLALQKHPAKPGEDSMPVIKIAELRNGVTSKSNRASRTVPEKYVLKDGDYIFSWSGSLMAKYWTEGEGALNQHLFKVTSETHPMWVVSNWVEHHLAEFQRIAAAKAVTMGHIKRSHLSEAMCVLPRPDDFGPMGEVIQPIMDLMIQNELENQTLAATRDLLLPKLMSGEIRLKDAEAAE